MKVFLIKLFILSAIISSVFLCLAYAGRPDVDPAVHHLGALVDKHRRLNEAGPNRLILVGGSSVAFGIDSKKIEENTGHPVVNLGLHAGLGIDFILGEITQNVRANDVILLMLEYNLYNEIYGLDPTLVYTAQRIFPESKSYYQLSIVERLEVLHRQFKRFFNREVSNEFTNELYNRNAFNEYGDIVSHLKIDRPVEGKSLDDNLEPVESIQSLEKFRLLSEKCREVNAKVFLVMPNYPKSQYKKNREAVDQVVSEIKEKLYFIPILGDQQTFLVDDSDLFDTVYHLNATGRSKKTDRLIQLLRENNLSM